MRRGYGNSFCDGDQRKVVGDLPLVRNTFVQEKIMITRAVRRGSASVREKVNMEK